MHTKRFDDNASKQVPHWALGTALAAVAAVTGTVLIAGGGDGGGAQIQPAAENSGITGTVAVDGLNVRALQPGTTEIDLTATPLASLAAGATVQVSCQFTGTEVPAEGSQWYRISGTGVPTAPNGAATVAFAPYLTVTGQVPECAQEVSGGAAASGVDQTATAAQGGCNPYEVQALGIGTFNMNVCLRDNGTGTTAYPSVQVVQVPAHLGTSCSIAIELWDDYGHSFGEPGQAGCGTGTYDGHPFTPALEPLTLHAFARLRTCSGACTSYHLGDRKGDSPSIEVHPSATSPKTSKEPGTGEKTKRVPPPPPIPTDQRDREQRDCLHNRPTNGQTLPGHNSIVENNGNGWNRYTTGPGNRPNAATACLTKIHVKGTRPLVIPYGMKEAQDIAEAETRKGDDAPRMYKGAQDVTRCHLIAGNDRPMGDSLGGNGGVASNLVPCWQRSTNAGMTTQEKAVRNLIAGTPDGGAIYYQVTPIYLDVNNSTVPFEIHLVAYRQVPGGSTPGVELLNVTIPNKLPVRTMNGKDRIIQLGN